ncbi:msrA [Symbiodinium natans]|uniref:peptide-methionine (S)-S-oxide reductase n=1 Tax=Symbiodinium natans TaxID=878477 RepID=A0A812NMH7_9DINO|nr:msrA [Symbiodinium natans]
MVQAQFDQVPGVLKTTVGYTGGRNANPSYESVCAGDGHTEAIQIEYDPEKVSYDALLDAFLKGHQPMRSKAQYKSAIWYHNEEQRKEAERRMEEIGAGPVVDVDEAVRRNRDPNTRAIQSQSRATSAPLPGHLRCLC